MSKLQIKANDLLKRIPQGDWELSPLGYRVVTTRRDAQGNLVMANIVCDTAWNKASRNPENAALAEAISLLPDLLRAVLSNHLQTDGGKGPIPSGAISGDAS